MDTQSLETVGGPDAGKQKLIGEAKRIIANAFRHQAVNISNVELDSLAAMTTTRLQLYGPPTSIVWDGESSISAEEAEQWADRWRIDLLLRPKGKKAWLVERHHEILRQQYHKTQSQLRADQGEHRSLSCETVLAECVLAKNMLLSIGEGRRRICLYTAGSLASCRR